MKKSSLMILLIILAAVAAVCAIAALLFAGLSGGSGQPPVSVTVDDIPTTTEERSLTLSGTVTTEKYLTTLTVNGETVEAVMKNEHSKAWSKTVDLVVGENGFVISAVDEKGNSDTKNVFVTYNDPGPFPEGTVFVKSVTAGIYVRPTPEVSKKHILYIQGIDYSTQLVYLGKYQQDADGIHTWYKVKTPASGDGWVRSDLVAPAQPVQPAP